MKEDDIKSEVVLYHKI